MFIIFESKVDQYSIDVQFPRIQLQASHCTASCQAFMALQNTDTKAMPVKSSTSQPGLVVEIT